MIYALGDLSMEGSKYANPSLKIFSKIMLLWGKDDFVVGNLESPLLEKGTPAPYKCVLKGKPGWAEIMRSAGVRLVSLANNHVMDYGPAGLLKTIKALEGAEILFIGAGENIEKARLPYFQKIDGTMTAFLARSNVFVNSSNYIASPTKPGVAFFEIEEIKSTVRECKKQADKVILLLHWGLEHYDYPPVSQKKLAKDLIEAGVDVIIGHHPHVLQGTERINNGIVCYSLGNFIFDDINWSFIDQDNKKQNRTVKLNHANRQGGVLRVNLAKDSFDYDLIPTVIRPDGSVDIHVSPERKNIYNRLSARLQMPCYNIFWKIYAFGREWNLRIKPMIQGKITWGKFRKIRFKHFQDSFHKIKKAAKIASGKSTNPYD